MCVCVVLCIGIDRRLGREEGLGIFFFLLSFFFVCVGASCFLSLFLCSIVLYLGLTKNETCDV